MKMIKNLLNTQKNWSFKGKIITQIFVLLLCISHATVGQTVTPKPFITKWDLAIAGSPNVGDPETAQITFNSSGTTAGSVNYTWTTEDMSMNGGGTFNNSTILSPITITGLPVGQAILLSISPTNFNQFQIPNIVNTDRNRLLDVIQWGDVEWSSMEFAFTGCSNLNISSVDKPDLRKVLKMDAMFSFCSKLNGPTNINYWDISNVKSINEMFYYASTFNQPLNNWDVSSVLDMGHTFSSASSFNQALNNWQVHNVFNMTGMFSNAAKFNQPINNWNVSKVIQMFTMFSGAVEFNQPLNLWDVSQVINMNGMFFLTTNFNQNLENWKFNPAVELSQFLDFSGLSVDKYDALLQALNGSTLSGRNLGAVGLRYCNALAARTNLINVKGWTITGDIYTITTQPSSITVIRENSATFSVVTSGTGLTYQWQEKIGMGEFTNIPDATNATYTIPTTSLTQNGNQYRVIVSQGTCSATSDAATLTVTPKPFITKWNLATAGLPNLQNPVSAQIRFNSSGNADGSVSYTWTTEDMSMNGGGTFNNSTILSPITITGLPVGQTILLSISPTNFSQFRINSNSDKNRLLDVTQWGDVMWSSMENAFSGCSNLNISATDVPILTSVTSLNRMFFLCSKLNGPTNIGTWNTSSITNMTDVFAGCSIFNQSLESWNTSSVQNFGNMFNSAVAFNQSVGSWDIRNATAMDGMFNGASQFNQSLANWATKFKTTVTLTFLLDNTGLSIDNYDATLQAFNSSAPNGRSLGAVGLRYCNALAARTNLINVKGWTITGDISNVARINVQPTSKTVIAGISTTFSVFASGNGLTALTYQWQEKTGMGEFTNITDATNATYTIPTTSLTQNGNQYRVVVTQGTCSTTSNAATLTVHAVPVITSFSPLSGIAGTTVTISGSGFNSTITDNIVYFGGMKAEVKSATPTTLEVIVPFGATYQNLSVTNLSGNRTGYSNKPFIVSNKGDFVFSPQKKLTTPANAQPSSTTLTDLDNDGKLDIIDANYDNTISVFRNTTANNVTSFSAPINFTANTTTNHVLTADIDGDGKQDIITVNQGANNISVFRNTSTSATINFDTKVDLTTGNSPYAVAVGDLNNDGKPDLVISNFIDNSLTIYANNSTNGSINLGVSPASFGYFSGSRPWGLKIRDMDNDGKNDIVVANLGNPGGNNLLVFKNTSNQSNISFASSSPTILSGISEPNALSIEDFDNDGLLDIATTDRPSNRISIFKNSTTNNVLSFAAKQDFNTGLFPYSIEAADFDGDGKLDLSVANGNSNSISILKNTTTNGTIEFLNKGAFSTYKNPYSVSNGDLNNDGKTDIVSGNYGGKNVSYLLQGNCDFSGQDGAQDNALNFDGINDHVEISNCAATALPVSDEITIEYWFKGSNMLSAVRFQTDADNYIVMGWQNNRHIISTDGGLNGLFFGANVTDGKWHHVAMTWKRGTVASGNGFRSYVDGRLANGRDVNTNINLPAIRTNFQLGSLTGSEEFMKGSLDEVRVWNIARTETQIAENMKKSPTDQNGLLIYYKFNHGIASGDNSGITQIKNEVSNSSYTGYLTDFALTGSSSNFVAPSPKNTRWYVKTEEGSDNNNGESWSTAFKTLKMATAQAIKGDEIWVAKGTYYPDEGPGAIDNNRNSSFNLVNGVAIYGGFSGTETLLSERNFKVNKTTLSGDLQKNDTPDFYANKSDNAYHVMNNKAVDATTLLDGFTISGGYSDDSEPNGERFGGAMLNKGLTNEGREADFSPTFRNLVIESNYAGSRGAGVYNNGSFGSMNPTFENCVFFDNRTGGQGGAMANIGLNHNLKVKNSVFVSNGVVSKGSAFLAENGNFEFTHLTFYKNVGTESGKVISVINNAKGTINNSIIGNENGSAISTENSATIQLNNSIYGDGNYNSTLLLPENVSGNNNLDANPQFLNTENLKGADNLWGTNDDGLNLRSCSPAIDLGTNILDTDITGAIRPYSTTMPDAGAYEFREAKLSLSASSNTPVCEGKDIILSITLSGSAQTISWMGPNNFSSTTGKVENVSANNAGIYTVSLTTLDGCTTTATTSVTVTVIQPPVINPPAQTSVCQPNKITLTASQCEGTITWFNETTGSTITLTEAKTYTVTATCTVENCTSKPSETLMIEIKQKPMPPTITPPTQKVVCHPNTLTLTASNCEGIISWNNGASTGTSFTLNEVNTYSVSATCTVNGCTSDASESINDLQIKQKPMPPIIEGTKNVCTPEPITLTATGCLGTITWSDNVTGSTRTFSEMGTYTYTATCTENGCVSEKSLESKSIIFQSPNQPIISPKQSNICEGNSITLVAFCPQMQVLWSNGSTGSVINVSPMTAGKNTFTVTCTAKNGCTSPSSEEAVVFVEAKPIQPIITPSSNTICSGNGLTLSAGSCDNGNGTLHWTNNQFGNSIYVTPSKTSKYRVACKSAFGCISDSSDVFIPIIIDIPSSPTVENKYVSKGNVTTLSATCSSGTPVWYESSFSRTSIAIGTLTTPVILTDKIYYVACETAPDSPVNCSSIVRSTQVVFVDNFSIISQPNHTYVCSGQNAVFKINVSGVSVMYQWQEYIDNNWINIENNKVYSGANSSILQLLSPPLGFDGKIYRCIVTNTLIDGTPTQFISDEVGLAVKVSALANNLIMVSPLLGINNIYQAVKTITAFNKILSNSKVSYFAGNSITLNPGFEVKSGNVFQAKVQSTCINTAFRLPDTITR